MARTDCDAIRADERWSFIVNGTHLRIVDAHRTWARHYLEFDLAPLAYDRDAFALLWRIGRAESLGRSPRLLDVAVDLSARHGAAVCGALASGVLDSLELLLHALARRATAGRFSDAPARAVTHGSLPRVVPPFCGSTRAATGLASGLSRSLHHRSIVPRFSRTPYRGLWLAVQAISRLAHAGCSAGELKVTAFNGRLFSPSRHRRIDREPIADEVMAKALLRSARRRQREAPPAVASSIATSTSSSLAPSTSRCSITSPTPARPARTRDIRKADRRVLHPAVAHGVPRPADAGTARQRKERRTDPEVSRSRSGDGQRRVSRGRLPLTWRRLAKRRSSRGPAGIGDVTAADRVALRREVAQRCLFGVDLNPMAVQLARLSLWLATLAADKPLSFLDHHLVAGNSLVGAPLTTAAPAGRRTRPRQRAARKLPLFDLTRLSRRSSSMPCKSRLRVAREDDDRRRSSAAKERTLAELHQPGSAGRHVGAARPVVRGLVLGTGRRSDRGTFAELMRRLLDRSARAFARVVTTPLARGRRSAAATEHDSCTGRSRFPRSSTAAGAAAQPSGGSTPSSATRRGTWSAATAAMSDRA